MLRHPYLWLALVQLLTACSLEALSELLPLPGAANTARRTSPAPAPPVAPATQVSSRPLPQHTASPEPLGAGTQITLQVMNPVAGQATDWYQKDSQTLVMQPDAQVQLQGTVILPDGTRSTNLTWSSADHSVATVQAGRVSAQQPGTVSIIARSVLYPEAAQAVLQVQVLDAANFAMTERQHLSRVQDITAFVPYAQQRLQRLQLTPGSKAQALAVVTLADGSKNGNVIWQSSDARIARIDADGHFEALQPGITTLVARYRMQPEFQALIELDITDQPDAMSPTLTPSATPAPSSWQIVLPTPEPAPQTLNAQDHNLRGNAAFAAGDYARAIADYTQAIQLSPQNPDYYDNRGNAHYKQGWIYSCPESLLDWRQACRLRGQVCMSVHIPVCHDKIALKPQY